VTRVALAAALALGASGCSWFHFGAESAEATPAGEAPRTGLAAEADRLLAADRAFAAKAMDLSASTAYREFFDAQGLHLPAAGEPVSGADAAAASVGAAPRLLTWEPQYAEVFAPGDWGWTWGEWRAHEPGAGGRRIAQGRYVNVWKKSPDGSWRVRADFRGAPAPAR
jgi:ketosteroid isomerase-like protein